MSRTIVGAAMLVIVESIRSSTSASRTMARIRRRRVVSPERSAAGSDSAVLPAPGGGPVPAVSSGLALWVVVGMACLPFLVKRDLGGGGKRVRRVAGPALLWL